MDVAITNIHPTENLFLDSFAFRYRTISGFATAALHLDHLGSIAELDDNIHFDPSWETYQRSVGFVVVAPGQSVRFFIEHFPNQSDPGALTVFDDIRIEGRAVPEAGGAALLALGAGALTLRRRRRGA